MRRIRFTISSLLIAVLFAGFGFAALREANEIWDSIVFSLTLGVLLTSILLAIHRTEKRQAFWLGFALSGSAYLGLSLVPSIESRLITTNGLAYLDSKVPGRPVAMFLVTGTSSGTGNNQVKALGRFQIATAGQSQAWRWKAATGGWGGTTENFVRIGHSLFALLAGWLGGHLSRRLCRVCSDPEPSAAVEAQGTAP